MILPNCGAPTASFSFKSGRHGFGELVLWKKKIERRDLEIFGPWPHMPEMLVLKWLKHMSANFRDIPANFRDIPANFRDICVLFFVSTKNMLQTCFQLLWEFSSGISPNFLGLPFSYLQPRLPFSYYVMERAAKACEEPENTCNDQKLRYFKFSSLSHPGSSKSRFCWISLFFSGT